MLLWMIIPVLSLAQDPHYSQFFNAPMYENPANTGNADALYRVGLNYRNQWNAVTKPFTTYAVSIDGLLPRTLFRKNRFGLGVSAMRDKAGDSEFGFASAGISGSWAYALNKARNQWFAAGIQLNWVQKSMLYTALRFGDQYDGYSFDPNSSTTERFATGQFSYADLNAGIAYRFLHQNTDYRAGLAVHHLTRPDNSFLGNEEITLPLRWVFSGSVILKLNENQDLQPVFSYQYQHPFNEFLLGTQFTHRIDNPAFPAGIHAGLLNRWQDALVFMGGLSYKNMKFTLSYDLNYSKLKPASDFRGGPEFSLILLFGKSNYTIIRHVNCPIF